MEPLLTKADLDRSGAAFSTDFSKFKVDLLSSLAGLMILQTAAIVALVALLIGHG
jgi:hypothetical protein